MDPVTLAFVSVGILLLLILAGLPIGYALLGAMVASSVMVGEPRELLYIAETAFQSLDSIELVALPMFIFMGAVVAVSPAGADIYSALSRLLPVPGGLGMSTIAGCAMFSAISGSSPATVAAMGSSGVPEMLARRYPPGLACGIVVGGGTLGILIPPSIVLLLYGVVTKTSIGQLFLAGILPGLMLVALFSLYTWFVMWRHLKRLTPGQRAEFEALGAERAANGGNGSFGRVIPFFALMAGIMLALYGGWATPSEIAAVGATASILLVLVIYRITSWSVWRELLLKTVQDTSMILIIAAFAYTFSQFLAFHDVVSAITSLLVDAFDNRWVTLFALWCVMLVLGCFLPPFAIVVIVAPMFLPFVLSAGFDPVWFGVFVTLNMEMGCITPPLGINLFVVKAIARKVDMREIMMGSLPFLAILGIGTLLITLFPEIVLFLPSQMMR
ncbi:TRAP transporter large permease [Nitratireductor aquimarinus]|uniref:TRAP transporter large permease n=1 Tax=Alphaproteobacteria TaxID=28211 RepID=UPI0019D33596|nr:MULTISPECIES: TRAP transporter large permease [Alphaproteobacteria]MBN7759269.1 TRAP transporter large permease [Nitratireductor aquimarinus]MBY6001549.1 TRAP transporter large permease [Tritonibacter mobilis]MBY6023837.1 TRAP transporter large permease [Nitratireductor sp. DP7N14-4]